MSKSALGQKKCPRKKKRKRQKTRKRDEQSTRRLGSDFNFSSFARQQIILFED